MRIRLSSSSSLLQDALKIYLGLEICVSILMLRIRGTNYFSGLARAPTLTRKNESLASLEFGGNR